MSAPLTLTAENLRDIAGALSTLSRMTREYDVVIGSYGAASITHIPTDTAISLSWDDEDGYRIDDRIGD